MTFVFCIGWGTISITYYLVHSNRLVKDAEFHFDHSIPCHSFSGGLKWLWNSSGGSRMLSLNAADPSSIFCAGVKLTMSRRTDSPANCPFPPIGFPHNHLLELLGNLSTSELDTDDAYVHCCSKLSLWWLQRLRTSVRMGHMARGNILIRGRRYENMYRIGWEGR